MTFREYGPSPDFPTDIYTDLKQVEVDEVWAIDIDRTIVKPELAVARLGHAALSYGIAEGALVESESTIQGGGGTSEPLSRLSSLLVARRSRTELYRQPTRERKAWTTTCNADFDAICRDFVGNPDANGILYDTPGDDAGQLLRELQASPAIPSFLSTSAASVPWQRMKVQAIGWRGYTEIIPAVYATDRASGETTIKTPPKGPFIESLRGPDGTYDFVGVTADNEPTCLVSARSVPLVDDKIVSFHGLPADCGAVVVRRPDEPILSSQSGELPEELSATYLHRLGQLSIARSPMYERQPFAVPTVAFVPAVRWLGHSG